MSAFLATLANGWSAFSVIATLGGVSGIVMIAAALILGAYLPATLRHLLVGAGIAILALSGVFQAGQLRGAHQQLALDAKRALDAEKARSAAAASIAKADQDRAAAELAQAQSDNAKLKDLTDALEREAHKRPRGAAPAPACIDRDLARRLRNL